ncbi:MAG: fibronectin type protein [Bacteroidetes bacterium]|jgi:hypothetical protein|nr:fibronectin type protein [Bacteroidota bacterium]
MKKIYFVCLLAGALSGGKLMAQLDYTMTPDNVTYTPLSGGTAIPDLSAGSDMTLTSALPIGFSFEFDDSTYTEFQMSENGYIHLGNEAFPTGYGSACCDAVIPNDFKDSSAMTPGMNTMRPFIAPLWEELAMANLGGNASYLTTGVSPNQILTIEWDKVSWRASTGTNQVSFQLVLHETTNVIEFIYFEGPIALGPLPTASIGLAGRTFGDYYSLSDSGTNPVASKTVNTTDISIKPATGQRYLWTPVSPAGIKENNAVTAMQVYFEKDLNSLHVSGDFSKPGNYEVSIMDMLGRKITQSSVTIAAKGKNKFTVQTTECAAGVYVVKIAGNGTVYQSKFTKE